MKGASPRQLSGAVGIGEIWVNAGRFPRFDFGKIQFRQRSVIRNLILGRELLGRSRNAKGDRQIIERAFLSQIAKCEIDCGLRAIFCGAAYTTCVYHFAAKPGEAAENSGCLKMRFTYEARSSYKP